MIDAKVLLGATLLAALPVPLAAQQAPTASAQADDSATIDSAIAALYAVISGPPGPRDWARFKALFVPEGRLVPVSDAGPRILTQQDYVERAGPAFAKDGFFETEIARRTELYGNVAHVFSTYQSRRTATGAPFARGINSIQIVRVAGKWRILSITWQGETPAFPLPDAYLPTKPAPQEK
ncbi:MAG: hypothetical protein K2W81_10440 [Sphingomonas sp.]|uniref:hypothetical protein n=1 Tax=Sphingomonas sp. TaxID=28214 RepID=UPI0025EA14FD|nr:hypothetical protein [Sphingomonas sp.]MBY0284368.1 hypothetical protein [Sphingomonas sp.]